MRIAFVFISSLSLAAAFNAPTKSSSMNVKKAVAKSLSQSAATAALAVAILAAPGSSIAASGGRAGGSSFRSAPSRSYSAPSRSYSAPSRSYSAPPSRTYIRPVPRTYASPVPVPVPVPATPYVTPFGYGGFGGFGGYGFGYNPGLSIGLSLVDQILQEQRRMELIRKQIETEKELGKDQAQIDILKAQLEAQEKKIAELKAQEKVPAN